VGGTTHRNTGILSEKTAGEKTNRSVQKPMNPGAGGEPLRGDQVRMGLTTLWRECKSHNLKDTLGKADRTGRHCMGGNAINHRKKS